MRVCMIAYAFYESDNRVMRYAEALSARGDDVEVFSLRQVGQPSAGTVNSVQVFRLQKRIKDETGPFSYLFRILCFFFTVMFVVTRKHWRRPYNIIHVHSVPDFLVFTAWLPKLTGAKVVLDIHDLLPELYADKFRCSPASLMFTLLCVIERLSALFANHVIAPNHLWQQKLVSRSVQSSKCTVFMNFPDLSIFHSHGRSRQDGKVIILYPGSLGWHQGLDIAIRAFAKIHGQVPQAEFHIYGEGSAKQSLIQLASELRLERKVWFHGTVPLREIAGIIENADLGVVPKRKDSFGNEAFSTKILEFMALGVPVVVADTSIDTYYFSDKLVTFFRSGDVDDLANCMCHLTQDPTARLQQARTAGEYVATNNWELKKPEYFSLLDRLTGATNSHGAADELPLASRGQGTPEGLHANNQL